MLEESEKFLTEKINEKYILKIDKTKKKSTPILFYLILILILFLFLLFLFIFIHFGNYKPEILIPESKMIKPDIDYRSYRVVRLTNNLEVTIISDINATICSASMALGVGTFQDDDDTNGLAHFFEHMIFLGSKSFPSSLTFENHLTQFLGSTNAFTEEEKTIFYFDIQSKGFETALHIFSRIFAEPLLDFSIMKKEINNLNIENERNINNDNWRQNQLIRSLANPHHPFSKFGTGNKLSLSTINSKTLHQKLKNFYKKYYVPENMKLVVQGNLEMNLLEEIVVKFFSDIRLDTLQREPELKYGQINSNESAFTKENLGKIVWFKKLSPSITLDFIFFMQDVNSKYKTKPNDYIAYMLKFAGDNSYFDYLKTLRWARKMDSGLINSYTSFSEFAITISLTEEGLKNVDIIIGLLFGYLNMIRNRGVDIEIYKEIKTINDNNFRFMEKQSDTRKYLSNLAGNMFDYEYKEIIYGDYCHSKYDETLIANFTEGFIVENSLIFIGSQNSPTDNLKELFFQNVTNKTEKWYGTSYLENKFNDSQLASFSKFSNELKNFFILRPSNTFITSENQTLNCSKKECFAGKDVIIPTLYYETDSIKIWHKIDKTFLIPKVNLFFIYLVKNIKDSAVNSTILHLFFNYIKMTIEGKLSDAVVAGNQIELILTENGLQITLEAYSDIVEKIFKEINEVVLNSNITESLFKEIHEITMNELKENFISTPYIKGFMIFDKIIRKNYKNYSEKIESLNSINYEKFTASITSLKKGIIFKALFYGNYNIHQIDNLKHYLAQYLPPSTKIEDTINYETQVRNINNLYIFRIKNDLKSERNNVIINYYQISVVDYKMSLISNIIEDFWGNIFHKTLKNKGFVVNCSKYIQNNVMYFRFVAQGSNLTPDKINHEIDKIISILADRIKKFSRQAMDEYKKSIHSKLYKREDNMKERSSNLWQEIRENSYFFDKKFKLSEELATIKVEDIISAFKKIFISDPKKLSIQIFAGNSNMKEINNSSENYYLNKKLHSIITNNYTDYEKLPMLTLPKLNYENYSALGNEIENNSGEKKK